MQARLVVRCAVLSTFVLAGCGGAPTPKLAPSVEPTITSQPAPQSTPLGQTATFSVAASGTAPLSYQWSKDGSPIAGATQTTYVTAPVQASDSGQKFSVRVSNAAGSIDSASAALAVGPRSPKVGDLRFNQVGALSTAFGPNIGGLSINLLPRASASYTNMVGMPFKLGPGQCAAGIQYNCSWFYSVLYLPANAPEMSVTYASDPMDKLATDLATYSASNAVINSLDEQPAYDIFALESTANKQSSGFAMTHSTVQLTGLQELATQLGTQSKVITALSFNAAGQIDVLSYSWQSDPSTIYDVQAVPVSLDTVGAEAQQMSNKGYIVTAFGGNSDSGYVLVGTKVQGDSMPRPIIVSPNMSTPGKGFAAVAMPTDWSATPYRPIWIFQQ